MRMILQIIIVSTYWILNYILLNICAKKLQCIILMGGQYRWRSIIVVNRSVCFQLFKFIGIRNSSGRWKVRNGRKPALRFPANWLLEHFSCILEKFSVIDDSLMYRQRCTSLTFLVWNIKTIGSYSMCACNRTVPSHKESPHVRRKLI